MANLYSAPTDIGNAAWSLSNATVNAAAIPSPDGLQDGKLLTENTATSVTHYAQQAVTVAASAVAYSWGAYAKASGRNFAIEFDGTGTGGTNLVYDLANGVVGTAPAVFGTWSTAGTATITNMGNGWYLLKYENFINTDSSTTITTFVELDSTTALAGRTYTGNGTSGAYATQLTLVQATSLPPLPFVPWIVKKPWIWTAAYVRR